MGISSLDAFAARHHGLVTRRAAIKAGLSERAWYRAIEAGQLERIHPGVCRMYGPRPRRLSRSTLPYWPLAGERWPLTARRRVCGDCPDPTTSQST
jgi:hypothetical protein